MILLNNLYTIIAESHFDISHDYIIHMNAEHFIYKAHFPGEPITPGVCILQIAHELIQNTLNRPLKIMSVKNAKFMNIISPDKNSEVHYTISKITDTFAADDIEARMVKAQVAVYDSMGVVYAKLSLIMKPEM